MSEQSESQPSPLLRNLARIEPGTRERSNNTMTFVDALQSMNIHSVFDIVRKSKPAFVRELSRLSEADGELAYENARCYATQIVRLYRNQLISSEKQQVLTRRTGIRSLVEIGPSFQNLFKENWDTFCKVGAIEAKDSPVAYLTSLYRFALEELEGLGSEDFRIPLHVRRPDLKNLTVDQTSTFIPVPTLTIVKQVLGAAITDYTKGQEHLKTKTIYQLVAEKKHPFLLPYNYPHHQAMLGLTDKKTMLGELSYRISLQLPIYGPDNKYGRVQNPSCEAQCLMSGLSPEQQTLVTEAAPTDPAIFYPEYYGVPYQGEESNKLLSTTVFMEKTGLNADELEALLSTGNYLPGISSNVTRNEGLVGLPHIETDQTPSLSFTTPISPRRYGSVYINNPSLHPEEQPTVSLVTAQNGNSVVSQATLDNFDRIHRIIRLQRWTKLPFAELDTLLVSGIRSEGADVNADGVLDFNTLRILGVYQYFSEQYTVKAEEFAAYIYYLQPFSTGDQKSFFDRAFNHKVLFEDPVKLDGYSITLVATTHHPHAVAKLCASLGLRRTEDSFIKVHKALDSAGAALISNVQRMSALYRVTRIAELFELSPSDLLDLVALLGGESYLSKMINGQLDPHSNRMAEDANVEPDILDILMQLDWAVRWLKETRRDVPQLRLMLGIEHSDTLATQSTLDLLNDLAQSTKAAVLDATQLEALNLPPDSKGEPVQWWTLLNALFDANGLVDGPDPAVDMDLHRYFTDEITSCIAAVEFANETIKAGAITLLSEFLLKGYMTQHRLVEGLLQSLAGLSMDRTEAVVRWAASSVQKLLNELLVATADQELAFPLSDKQLAFIGSLQQVTLYAATTQQMALSSQALMAFVAQPAWLDASFSEALPLSLASLYLLDRYQRWVDGMGITEEVLLNYLRMGNTATATKEQCAQALAPLINWSVSELLAASSLLERNIAICMAQIDWLRRVHACTEQTGLSVAHLLKATGLTTASEPADWQRVGEAAMAASR
jgi:hypothetical protein